MTAARRDHHDDMASSSVVVSGGGESADLSDDEDFDEIEPEVMQGERNLGEFSGPDEESDY